MLQLQRKYVKVSAMILFFEQVQTMLSYLQSFESDIAKSLVDKSTRTKQA